jgi:hypothetical protein
MCDVATDHLPANTTVRNDCSTLKADLELAQDRAAEVGRLLSVAASRMRAPHMLIA